MTKIFNVILLAVLFVPGIAQAQTVFCKKGDTCGIEWDANTEPDMHSYRVYYKPVTDVEYSKVTHYEVVHPTTNVTEITVALNIPDGEFNLVVTAVDTSGNESGYSNELTMRIDRTPPSTPVIRFIIPSELIQ